MMSWSGKEITIEGETYVDANRVYELLEGLISTDAIRELGKGWGRQKVGRYWFYRASDVRLPEYAVARWQKMTLIYMSLAAPDSPALEYADSDYYTAKSFLNGAGVEMVTTGTIRTSFGVAVFVLLSIGEHIHFVVTNDNDLAGRALKPGEYASRPVGGMQVLDSGPLRRVAEELLAPMRPEEAA